MLKILIIDDAPEKIANYRELLEEFQELSSDFIDMATSIEDAQEKLAKTQYDLAILDLYLPLRSGDEPNPENAITLLKDISKDEELNMPYNIVGITIWKNADPKYKDFFDSYLLAYIIYEQESDDWKDKLRNKIDFLLKAQRNVQNQEYYDYDDYEKKNKKISKGDASSISNIIDMEKTNIAAVARELFPDHTEEGAQSQLRKILNAERPMTKKIASKIEKMISAGQIAVK